MNYLSTLEDIFLDHLVGEFIDVATLGMSPAAYRKEWKDSYKEIKRWGRNIHSQAKWFSDMIAVTNDFDKGQRHLLSNQNYRMKSEETLSFKIKGIIQDNIEKIAEKMAFASRICLTGDSPIVKWGYLSDPTNGLIGRLPELWNTMNENLEKVLKPFIQNLPKKQLNHPAEEWIRFYTIHFQDVGSGTSLINPLRMSGYKDNLNIKYRNFFSSAEITGFPRELDDKDLMLDYNIKFPQIKERQARNGNGSEIESLIGSDCIQHSFHLNTFNLGYQNFC